MDLDLKFLKRKWFTIYDKVSLFGKWLHTICMSFEVVVLRPKQ
jgi:hypothetical protein